MATVRLLDIPETCDVLNIGRTTLYALFKSGELRLTRVRSRSFVDAREIERFCNAAVVDPDARDCVQGFGDI